jgi:release factor glutamine methyltransferase
MTGNIQTIKDIRFYLAKELGEIYQEPELKAISNLIIKTILPVSGLHQLYNSSQSVSSEQASLIAGICEELKTGKPIQYILGTTTFYNCLIKVNNSTLIPRQETEELVDLIIRENQHYTGNILDLGTGSGCIAISLGVNLPKSVITGIDVSENAISLARENALLNNVAISFLKADILNFDHKLLNKTGIIVSNPPYVRNSEKQFMSKNVLDFEPHLALFVHDSDPLIYYKAIMKIADWILIPAGKLYFEINEAMGQQVSELFNEYSYSDIKIFRDINNKDRIARGTKND